MKFKSSLLSTLLFVGGTLFASTALAQHTPWYVGFGLGYNDIDFDSGKIDSTLLAGGFATATTTSEDDSDFAVAIFGGYKFNDYIAVELSYNYLGEIDIKTTTTGPASTVTTDFDVHSVSLDAVGFVPINDQFSLLGRVGFFYWDGDADVTVPGFGTVGDDDSGVDFKFGVGAQYQFMDHYSVRADWQHFDYNTGDTNHFLLNLIYHI